MTIPSDGFADGGEFYTDDEIAALDDLDDCEAQIEFEDWLDSLSDSDHADIQEYAELGHHEVGELFDDSNEWED